MSKSTVRYVFFLFSLILILPLTINSGRTSEDDEIVTVIMSLKTSGRLYADSLPNNIYYRPEKIAELMNSNVKKYRSLMQFASKFKEDESIIEMTPVWIANSLIVKAQRSIIEKLAESEMVDSVHADRIFNIIDPVRRSYDPIDEGMDIDGNGYTYGLNKMGIPLLLKEFPGALGTDVKVGHIDTGINPDHPDLKGRLIAFKDFVNGREDAYDDNDHGTHTTGTIAGGNASGVQIGVAPGAKLIVAKVFNGQGSASEANLLKAMQWIADPDGDPKTPDGPVVVSNSWGGRSDAAEKEKPFMDAVANWVSLGIFPCFAAGNSGPASYTVNTPGGFTNAFAVGASDENDLIADFSSRGPFRFLEGDRDFKKPDVSAPGDNVYSAIANGKWAKFKGTSMATPHVAGLVALIFQAKPNITTEEVGRVLTGTVKDIDIEGFDFNSGWGRVDAYGAIKKLLGKEEQNSEEYYDEFARQWHN